MDAVDTLIENLRQAEPAGRDAIKAQLIEMAQGADGIAVQEYLDNIKRGELLEIQWEIEEVLEATAPPPPVAEEPPEEGPEAEEPAEEDPNRQLTAADLQMVYDDPRGVMLHKSKVGDRWFLTQVDPRTCLLYTSDAADE